MDAMETYSNKIEKILKEIREKERKNLTEAAELISTAVEKDELIHVFGTGAHSIIGAMEVFYRAGGLACINPIFPPGVSHLDSHPNTERLVGYARSILDHYGVKRGDIIIIINVNGINAMTIDSALEAKRRGAKVIAITSSEFSKNIPRGASSRHPSNKNLYELGDIVIDAHIPPGDALVEIEGLDSKISSGSTIANCFILNCLFSLVIEKLVQRGITPPIWKSANIPGGDEANEKYVEKYAKKVKHLYSYK